MRLRVKSLWSPDLSPPSEGGPRDAHDFDVFLQMAIEEEGGSEGHEVFNARVCSPSALSRSSSGEFVNALVLRRFDWMEIHGRLNKLLLHASSCPDWAAAIQKLAPFIQHADSD